MRERDADRRRAKANLPRLAQTGALHARNIPEGKPVEARVQRQRLLEMRPRTEANPIRPVDDAVAEAVSTAGIENLLAARIRHHRPAVRCRIFAAALETGIDDKVVRHALQTHVVHQDVVAPAGRRRRGRNRDLDGISTREPHRHGQPLALERPLPEFDCFARFAERELYLSAGVAAVCRIRSIVRGSCGENIETILGNRHGLAHRCARLEICADAARAGQGTGETRACAEVRPSAKQSHRPVCCPAGQVGGWKFFGVVDCARDVTIRTGTRRLPFGILKVPVL